MAKFKVWFSPDALDDIMSSYEWGCVTWGEEAAKGWVRDLHDAIYVRLTEFPMSCPIAPESSDLDFEVRQLVFLRYRILFEIDRRQVIVLHVHGPYAGDVSE